MHGSWVIRKAILLGLAMATCSSAGKYKQLNLRKLMILSREHRNTNDVRGPTRTPT